MFVNRTERVCCITQILCNSPNKDFSLNVFAQQFDCAKSSISEDMKLVREAMNALGYGYLETTSGSKGGVRFVPYVSDEKAHQILDKNDMLRSAKPNLKILHPLPRVNEIAQDVDDNPMAYYFQQAKNGLYVREALICNALNLLK